MSTDFIEDPRGPQPSGRHEPPDEGYRGALERFISRPSGNVHAGHILRLITGQYTTGPIAKLREAIVKEDKRAVGSLIDELRKKAVEEQEFSASIIPTVVSTTKARSMKMIGGEASSDEAVYWWLYLQLSGVLVGNHIVNLLYVNEDARLDFLDRLIDEGALILGRSRFKPAVLSKVLGNKFPLDREFCAAFAYLNYFAYWVKKNSQPLQLQDMFGLPDYMFKKLCVTDRTTLVVVSIPTRQGRREAKRSLRFIPKISSFLTYWYRDYWSNKDEYPWLGRFISSLYNPDGGDESKSFLNSFLYELMNNRVNSLLLSRLATIRADGVLTRNSRRAKPIPYARQFLQKVL